VCHDYGKEIFLLKYEVNITGNLDKNLENMKIKDVKCVKVFI